MNIYYPYVLSNDYHIIICIYKLQTYLMGTHWSRQPCFYTRKLKSTYRSYLLKENVPPTGIEVDSFLI